MTIERFVRPFQIDSPFQARVLPPVDGAEVVLAENVIVTITSKSDTNYVEGPPPWALGYQAEWVEDPTRRVTDRVRVENPEDSSQFVEVERIKQMVVKNTGTGEEIPIKPTFTS